MLEFYNLILDKDNAMNCEHMNTCSIIQHMSKIVPFTVNMMKIKYCEFNKNRCARYQLQRVLEMDKIPDDLWPTDEFRGLELSESKLNETHKKLYGSNLEDTSA